MVDAGQRGRPWRSGVLGDEALVPSGPGATLGPFRNAACAERVGPVSSRYTDTGTVDPGRAADHGDTGHSGDSGDTGDTGLPAGGPRPEPGGALTPGAAPSPGSTGGGRGTVHRAVRAADGGRYADRDEAAPEPAGAPESDGAAPVSSDGTPGSGRPPPRAAPRAADDERCQIKGFTSDSTVAPGDTLDFRVTVNPPQRFTVDVYRVGHGTDDHAGVPPGGPGTTDPAGARHQATPLVSSPPLTGTRQPRPLVAGRTVSCHHWSLSWRLPVPATWRSGSYVAVLTTVDGAFRSHVPFTVRGREPADLLLVLPDLTWQAHNLFPEDGRTGASLRHAWDTGGRLLGEVDAAVTVSFDRPYAGSGLPVHIGHAHDVIRWAERYGYDLSYATARDLHAGRVEPAGYRGVIFPGHDAYWSAPMRDRVEAARDAGTSLVFLSANSAYWQVDLGPLPSGDADRLLTCHKRRGAGRPALWRERGRPEQHLLGIQYAGTVPRPQPLVVRNADHWLWQATGAAEAEELPGLVAGEADRYFPRAPLPDHRERTLLAHSPYRDAAGARRHQETSVYRAHSGAWVFAAGTSAWAPALDRPGHLDSRVQRATANLLDRICQRD